MGHTILIAEDNPAALKFLIRYFSTYGFTVYPAATNAASIELAKQHHPECFLLDYHLADGDASAVCRFVRNDEHLKNTPVIIRSGDLDIEVASYNDCQADIFVDKCSSYTALLAIVRRQLKRAEWSAGRLAKADLTLDAPNLRLLRTSYPPIQLSPEQFRFFSLLLEQSQEFVTENTIYDRVFAGATPGNSAAICALVYRLRQRLGPQLSRRIKSKRGRGWIYLQPRLRVRPRHAALQQA